MEQYIIVKVRDAKASFPEKAVAANGQLIWPHSNVAKIRRAIHATAVEQFISISEVLTHTPWLTQEETEAVDRIFNDAMNRAKRATPPN